MRRRRIPNDEQPELEVDNNGSDISNKRDHIQRAMIGIGVTEATGT